MLARAEEVPLCGPYALVTAGASLHWMDWEVLLPRIREVLSPNGVLAMVDNQELPVPWAEPLRQLIARYSTNREYRPYDLVAELEQRRLFGRRGQHTTAQVTFTQPVTDYIQSFHARNGFSRDRMHPTAADAFDRALEQLVRPYAPDGMVTLELAGEVTWGRPRDGLR